MIIGALDNGIDLRDKCSGMRQFKKKHQPNQFARRTKHGKHITQKQRAQKTADYFSQEQCGKKRKKTEEETDHTPNKAPPKIDYCKNTDN